MQVTSFRVHLLFLMNYICILSAVLALAWPGSQGFGLAFLGFGFTKP